MAETNKESDDFSTCHDSDNDSREADVQEFKGNAECLSMVSNVPECAVCLQTCVHPACLPCSHVFCYLCVKGVANQSKRCPMCRQEIPADFLERPQLLEIQKSQQEAAAVNIEDSVEDQYEWFYEGRNGWWQYDQRTNLELENAYKQGRPGCELLIAGFLYIADFTTMFQFRRNDHSRRRRIKRDLYNAPKKGVAGLRLNNSVHPEQSHQQHQQSDSHREVQETEQPVNLPQDERTDLLTGNHNVSTSDNQNQQSTNGSTVDSITNWHLYQNQQSGSLHQVLEQMRSIASRRSYVQLTQLLQPPNSAYQTDEEHT